MFKPTVCIDFDGVIHSYKSGWDGKAYPPDPPVPGAAEAIAKLRKKYKVVVYSARCHLPNGMHAVEAYLEINGIKVDEVCEQKPPAIIYIDDRAIQFNGDWGQTIKDIENFKWWLGAKNKV